MELEPNNMQIFLGPYTDYSELHHKLVLLRELHNHYQSNL